MPPARLALILLAVISAAGLTVWIGWALSGGGAVPFAGITAVAATALAVRLLVRTARRDRS